MSARPRRHASAALGVALALVVGCASAASAIREVGGASFATTRQVGGATMELLNAALYRYLVFDVYAAALYLAPGAGPQAALADGVARRLEVVYLRDIDAADLVRAAHTVLERSLEPAALALVAPRVERLHGWFRDVKEGDRIALSWVPGNGTTLERNGERLGTIEGAEFARAYFSIWLGETPIDSVLRADLLASRETEGAGR